MSRGCSSSFALAAILLTGMPAVAVCLNGHRSVGEEYRGSKAVVLARVVGQREVPETGDGFYFDATIYRIRIERAFQGSIDADAEIFSENSSGRFPMVVGSKYLLFIYERHDRLLVDYCGNSGLLSRRGKELRELERLAGRHRAVVPTLSGSPVFMPPALRGAGW
jgi:hypothetical protein